MSDQVYIHGTSSEEQLRLAELNRMTNEAFITYLEQSIGEIQSTHQVLEVGSGLGLLAQAIALRWPHCRVTGVEQSSEQLRKVPLSPSNLHFVQGSALSLPLAPEVFDVVYFRYVLEHLTDPTQALREAYRVLRSGGRITAQENDISLVRLDPECKSFTEAWECFARYQSKLGCDAFIGTKLFRLVKHAEFTNITLSLAEEVHWFGRDTFAPWIENLVGNLKSAHSAMVREQFCTEKLLENAYNELREFVHRSDASAFFAWNRVSATKP